MTEQEIIVGLIRLVRSVAEQQAMPDDFWERDPSYVAALELPITRGACRRLGERCLSWMRSEIECGDPFPICAGCRSKTAVPSDIQSIADSGLCGGCLHLHNTGELEVLEC